MKLQEIWSDVRHGENIDLYAAVAISVVSVVLGLIGRPIAADTLQSMTLAVLGLIAVSILLARRQMESLSTTLQKAAEPTISDSWSESIDADIAGALELTLVGINLRRTVTTRRQDLEGTLARGGLIRSVIIDPESTAVTASLLRADRSVTEASARNDIRSTLEELSSLIAPGMSSKLLDVRVIDFPLGFGAIAVDSNLPHGKLYIELYGFRTAPFDRVKLTLTRASGDWYVYFLRQIEQLLDVSKSWNHASK